MDGINIVKIKNVVKDGKNISLDVEGLQEAINAKAPSIPPSKKRKWQTALKHDIERRADEFAWLK